MRIRAAVLGMASAMAFAGEVRAQHAPTKEFGIDLGISSTGMDGQNDRLLSVGSPVDVRIGFLTSSRLSLEPRFTLLYQSVGSSSLVQIQPSFNVLIGLSSAQAHRGPYVTAGALLDFYRADFGGGPAQTTTQPGFTLGFGTRLGWGDNAAFRPELFATKKLEQGDIFDANYAPGTTEFGVRLGISFFH